MTACEPVGAPIPGSRFVRDYCRVCRDPIRVTTADGLASCQDCSGTAREIAQSQAVDRVDRKLRYLPEHGHEGGRRG